MASLGNYGKVAKINFLTEIFSKVKYSHLIYKLPSLKIAQHYAILNIHFIFGFVFRTHNKLLSHATVCVLKLYVHFIFSFILKLRSHTAVENT